MYTFEVDDHENGSDPMGLEVVGSSGNCNGTSSKCVDKATISPWVREAASIGVGFIPVVGSIQMATQAVTGRDHITGHNLGTVDRIIAGAGVLLPPLADGAKELGIVEKVAGPVGRFVEHAAVAIEEKLGGLVEKAKKH